MEQIPCTLNLQALAQSGDHGEKKQGTNHDIYDLASGTGGMLSVAKEHLLERADTPEEKGRVEKYVTVHGQELSPTNYAVCQADLLIKNDRQATVHLGNSLIPHDPHGKEPGDQWPEAKWRFNRMLPNPPFGVTWGGKDGYEKEARKLEKSRYQAGMPRVNDGALLFLQTMLAKMAPAEEGGSRVAIVFNGSPLSNGDCGSGESEIRRWILENDWLDAIVMLPDQLFYNTGIFTYIWLLRNDKPDSYKGRVMLIDARQQFEKEPKSFGNKRHRIADVHRAWIEERYTKGWAKEYDDERVKIFPREDFAYHKVRVVFWQTDEHDQPATITEPYEKAFTAANVTKEQGFHESDLSFRVRVMAKGREKTVEFTVKVKENAAKKIKEALADADETLFVEWTHRHYVQDDEYIPHGEDIAAFLQREIAKPIIRWEETRKNGKTVLGYEILPNKYFYRYQPPTPAKELLAEFWRMRQFYLEYSSAEFLAQAVPEISRPGGNISRPGVSENFDQVVALDQEPLLAQLVPELLCPIPWGHHIEIMKKIKLPAARLWYLRATAKFGWSRKVLLNQIKAGAYERAVTEKKTHNFPLALPEYLAEQADEMLKSTYNLEFLGIRRQVKEREQEDRLVSRLQAFLLNDKERGPDDQLSIGIILCAEKDDVEVEYALRSKANPIGVAVYELQSKLPGELQGKLPTAKQLADLVRAEMEGEK